jgi:2-(1,2-epoxy-1,2-dihydrophenyl)acetyl-CoA isomerase
MSNPPGDVPVLEYRPGRISHVVFNRPQVKNALNAESWVLLARALEDFAADEHARVLVLSGAGATFSAGADVTGNINAPAEQVGAKMREVADIVLRLHRMPKPVVAKVDGAAVGVAMSLALGCDLVIASDRARFGAVFAKIGLTPDGGLSWLLPQLVGLHKAKELVLFPGLIDAARARELGLVNTVVPAEELDAVTDEWCEQLAALAPKVAEGALALLDGAWTSTLPEALAAEADAQQAAVAELRKADVKAASHD